MKIRWSPMPWVLLEEDGAELALNAVIYAMGLSLVATLLWLAHIAWVERDR